MRSAAILTILFAFSGCKSRTVQSEAKETPALSKAKVGYMFVLDSQKGKAFWSYESLNGKSKFILRHTNMPTLTQAGWNLDNLYDEAKIETPYLYFLSVIADDKNEKLKKGLEIEKFVKVTMANKLKTESLESSVVFDLSSKEIAIKELGITGYQLYKAVYSAMAYSKDFADTHPNIDPSTMKPMYWNKSPAQLFHEEMLKKPH